MSSNLIAGSTEISSFRGEISDHYDAIARRLNKLI